MTVTEKGYCHVRPAARLDSAHPDIVHDLADPQRRAAARPILRALELRVASHGGRDAASPATTFPPTAHPRQGGRTFAQARGHGLARWIEANVAFPSTMVDRIVPATRRRSRHFVERASATAIARSFGEPFRQWVIEDDFAGRAPALGRSPAHLRRRRRAVRTTQDAGAERGADRRSPISALLVGHRAHLRRGADPVLAGRPPHDLEESTADAAAGAGMELPAYLDTSFAASATRHPPSQPPDRHRRLAEDRAAHAQPDPRSLEPRRKHRAAADPRRRLDGLSDPGVGTVRQALAGVAPLCRQGR